MDTATQAPSVAHFVPALVPFPMAAVEVGLLGELIEAVKIEASIRGHVLPSDPVRIATAEVHVDSLVVVAILCVVEPIVGFELPESVVRAGGYVSVDSALRQLLPRIEEEWMKRKGTKP